jgi:hypothetical protein
MPPLVRSAREGTDKLSNPPPERRIIHPHLPVFGIHRLDKALGQGR